MNTRSIIPEVAVPRATLQKMQDFAALMLGLKKQAAYQQWIAKSVPASAMLGNDDAPILMGFDFHLSPDGPKLIEINNNAGGLFTGINGWLPQPAIDGCLTERLLQMFPEHWQSIAIVDADIEQQFMFPEMLAYAGMLREAGRDVFVCSPEAIVRRNDGLYVENQRLDAIYNRHTDFYLQTPAMAHICDALQHQHIALNPFPRSYALLGDKNRMADWWQADVLEQWFSAESCAIVRNIVPQVQRLQDVDADTAWSQRKRWVFKPPDSHAGKGVVLGKAMSRKRFASLDRCTTLMQEYIPASEITSEHGETFRFDVRLYMHGATSIAWAGRAWRGQLTNFREQGSGWTSIQAVDDRC
ncbi:MAG: hypothetical protein Q9M22_02495 [Mariprofundaceae bacterium]|nr:hypothetical protein [Mariprofundaceae bacterium]